MYHTLAFRAIGLDTRSFDHGQDTEGTGTCTCLGNAIESIMRYVVYIHIMRASTTFFHRDRVKSGCMVETFANASVVERPGARVLPWAVDLG